MYISGAKAASQIVWLPSKNYGQAKNFQASHGKVRRGSGGRKKRSWQELKKVVSIAAEARASIADAKAKPIPKRIGLQPDQGPQQEQQEPEQAQQPAQECEEEPQHAERQEPEQPAQECEEEPQHAEQEQQDPQQPQECEEEPHAEAFAKPRSKAQAAPEAKAMPKKRMGQQWHGHGHDGWSARQWRPKNPQQGWQSWKRQKPWSQSSWGNASSTWASSWASASSRSWSGWSEAKRVAESSSSTRHDSGHVESDSVAALAHAEPVLVDAHGAAPTQVTTSVSVSSKQLWRHDFKL